MPSSRVNEYWHTPAPPEFADYIIGSTGLSPEDQQIARNYRAFYGDTQYFADLAGLPIKKFNQRSGDMHRRVMSALIPLAIEGWEARRKPPVS